MNPSAGSQLACHAPNASWRRQGNLCSSPNCKNLDSCCLGHACSEQQARQIYRRRSSVELFWGGVMECPLSRGARALQATTLEQEVHLWPENNKLGFRPKWVLGLDSRPRFVRLAPVRLARTILLAWHQTLPLVRRSFRLSPGDPNVAGQLRAKQCSGSALGESKNLRCSHPKTNACNASLLGTCAGETIPNPDVAPETTPLEELLAEVTAFGHNGVGGEEKQRRSAPRELVGAIAQPKPRDGFAATASVNRRSNTLDPSQPPHRPGVGFRSCML